MEPQKPQRPSGSIPHPVSTGFGAVVALEHEPFGSIPQPVLDQKARDRTSQALLSKVRDAGALLALAAAPPAAQIALGLKRPTRAITTTRYFRYVRMGLSLESAPVTTAMAVRAALRSTGISAPGDDNLYTLRGRVSHGYDG